MNNNIICITPNFNPIFHLIVDISLGLNTLSIQQSCLFLWVNYSSQTFWVDVDQNQLRIYHHFHMNILQNCSHRAAPTYAHDMQNYYCTVNLLMPILSSIASLLVILTWCKKSIQEAIQKSLIVLSNLFKRRDLRSVLLNRGISKYIRYLGVKMSAYPTYPNTNHPAAAGPS